VHALSDCAPQTSGRVSSFKCLALGGAVALLASDENLGGLPLLIERIEFPFEAFLFQGARVGRTVQASRLG
jgi:hypothetical protein